MLNDKETKIADEYEKNFIGGGKMISKYYDEYKNLMLKFIRTMCDKKYKGKLIEYVSKKYYPI